MRTGIQLVLSAALMLALGLILRADSLLIVTFINVGQGDSCWLQLPNGDDVPLARAARDWAVDIAADAPLHSRRISLEASHSFVGQ